MTETTTKETKLEPDLAYAARILFRPR